jgi:hypothetical protein
MQRAQWKRWGQWAAHLYVDDTQSCHTPHGQSQWISRKRSTPTVPQPAMLAETGTPFGRVCQKCLREWHRLKARGAL